VTRETVTRDALTWQSKLVLLLVLPFVGTDVFLECQWWFGHWWLDQSSMPHAPSVLIWTLGLSSMLGLVTWKVRAATPAAAATGAAITASLMFATVRVPYEPWNTALTPILAVTALAFAATRAGRAKKERLGTAEPRKGRVASQVAANLGVAALVTMPAVQSWLVDRGLVPSLTATLPVFALGLAALAEAAADTVSSEIGQVLGGRPRMITTLRAAEPGTDGAISIAGTLAGVIAACMVAGAGTWAMRGDRESFLVSCAGGVFGLLFDSLLGATLERQGWLNNDAVNFLSTASAAGFALGMLALWR
jgi:uncharacterized protein (TIGR00297 family)